VELEEDTSPSFGEDDEMEAVEIETLQDVEPLPMPAGSSRGGEPPLESAGPGAGEGPQDREDSTRREPEPEVLEIPEPEPEMIEICEEEPERVETAAPEPEPEPDVEPPVPVPTVDLDILRAALVALQERVEAVAARTRDLDGEAQALREQIETVKRHLLG
jgi:hypothetical protein